MGLKLCLSACALVFAPACALEPPSPSAISLTCRWSVAETVRTAPNPEDPSALGHPGQAGDGSCLVVNALRADDAVRIEKGAWDDSGAGVCPSAPPPGILACAVLGLTDGNERERAFIYHDQFHALDGPASEPVFEAGWLPCDDPDVLACMAGTLDHATQ